MAYLGFRQAVAAVKGDAVTTQIGMGTVTATKADIGEPDASKCLSKGNCI